MEFMTIVRPVIASCIVLISLIGNFLICIIVKRTKILHNFTNYMLVNYSVAAIVAALFFYPFRITLYFLDSGYWPFGSIWCKLSISLAPITVIVYSQSLICISYARFRAICCPLKPSLKPKLAILSSLTIWLITLLLTIPYML
ncbi:uncharacterized protein TRIADDRAFT_30381, partial [Trichoplax adhaerens]